VKFFDWQESQNPREGDSVLIDVTVDTNVFLHSANQGEERCAASREFLHGLLDGDTFLCIDEGFDIDESRNKSIIGCEYLANLRFVDPAFAVIVALGKKGRILGLKRTTDSATQRRILRLISNKIDRTFLKISFNSRSRILVSHDFTDFPLAKRGAIRNELGVNITEASAAHLLNRR
jgi:hypothetical protein